MPAGEKEAGRLRNPISQWAPWLHFLSQPVLTWHVCSMGGTSTSHRLRSISDSQCIFQGGHCFRGGSEALKIRVLDIQCQYFWSQLDQSGHEWSCMYYGWYLTFPQPSIRGAQCIFWGGGGGTKIRVLDSYCHCYGKQVDQTAQVCTMGDTLPFHSLE